MEENRMQQTMLDQLVTDERSQMLKAAIPYLPPGGRSVFAVYAKFLELTHTMRLFSDASRNTPFPADTQMSGSDQLHAASVEDSGPVEMLQDISRYCTGATREKLDSLMNLVVMIQMMQIMNEPEE